MDLLTSVKELPRMDDLFDIEVGQPDVGRAVVVFKGEHDLSQAQALSELLSTLIAENELVVADFSHAYFVDSSVINVLVETRREAERGQRRFRIQMGTESVVRRVFEVAGVLSFLECASSRQEALGENPHSET
jgi:anti-anti-sigma factor